MIWFNPPFNANVTTDIGRQFLKLLKHHFPNYHPLHKIINTKKVKLSYSCTKNMKSLMQAHNNKLIKPNIATTDSNKKCNCRTKNRNTCPLGGNCLSATVVYETTTILRNTTSAALKDTSKHVTMDTHKHLGQRTKKTAQPFHSIFGPTTSTQTPPSNGNSKNTTIHPWTNLLPTMHEWKTRNSQKKFQPWLPEQTHRIW